MLYNAFISYSHSADDKLAAALQSGLHRFARPWYRLRALHIFRDQTNLAVNPQLWTNIKSALDQADWFILLASPAAAASVWVDREIEYWLAQRRADRILTVLTEGTIAWDAGLHGFDAQQSSALPKTLLRAFAEEPLYLDLTWARGDTELALNHPRFRDAIAEVAAAVSGRPKDELIGEDVRQHRRMRRIAWSAAIALAALTLAALAASVIAVRQRDVAEVERARAVEQSQLAQARQLAAQSGSILTQSPEQLPLAALLALESTRIASTTEGNRSLRAALALLPRAVRSHSYEERDAGRVRALSFSADGRKLAIARDDGTVSVLSLAGNAAATVLSHEENPGAIVGLPDGGVQWKAPGFGAEVTSVAFASNGKLLASGDNDKTARLWDAESGRELRRLPHDDGVSSVAFNPPGTLLATGSKDAAARVWDTATGREVFRIRHGAEVRAVAFSPDGRYLAAISTDGAISVADVPSRAERHRWDLGEAGLGLAFSPDGAHLATASGEYAGVWDVATGRLILRVRHASLSASTPDLNWIDDVAFSADGKLLATAGRDATARVWDLSSGQELLRLQHGAPVSDVSFSRDGALLSTASVDGAARVWELSSGKERLRATQPGGAETVQFSPDGSVVASGAMNGAVDVWKLDRGDQLSVLTQSASVNVVSAAPNGMFAASSGGMVQLWSATQSTPPRSVKLPVVRVDALTFDEQGMHMAAAWSRRLFLVDIGKQLTFTSLTTSIRVGDVAIGPRYVAAFDRERGALRVWETAGGRELPPIPDSSLDQLRFDVTGAVLAARHQDDRGDGFIGLWRLPEARELVRVPERHSASFTIAAEGKAVAVSAIESTGERAAQYVDVHDGTTGMRIARIRHEGDVVASFNPRGDRLLLAQNTRLSVFDAATGQATVTLGHEEDIQRVRGSSEDGVLATVAGGNVYVWNYRTGQLLSELSSAGYVQDVRFSADGRYLLTGSSDHTAAVWLWKTKDLREAACMRVSRNLTREEWTRYLGTPSYEKTCPNLK